MLGPVSCQRHCGLSRCVRRYYSEAQKEKKEKDNLRQLYVGSGYDY